MHFSLLLLFFLHGHAHYTVGLWSPADVGRLIGFVPDSREVRAPPPLYGVFARDLGIAAVSCLCAEATPASTVPVLVLSLLFPPPA